MQAHISWKLPFWGRLAALQFLQRISLDAGRASFNTSHLAESKFTESREVAPRPREKKGGMRLDSKPQFIHHVPGNQCCPGREKQWLEGAEGDIGMEK